MKSLKAVVYRWISQKFMAGCSNYNSLQVRKASRSKQQARKMFAQHDIPHAKGAIFVNPYTAYRFAQEHGFPICIKPNVSGFSRGSHFPITNFKQLWKAALLVKVWWPTSIIEQYLEGANYRVLATEKDMVSVIRRYPPFVDGNGRDMIGRLIDDTIPEANRELFLKVINAFDARLFGIDVIFEQGIEKDYREQRCIFLEVNSRPYTRMHSYPRYGTAENLDAFYNQMDALHVADSDTF